MGDGSAAHEVPPRGSSATGAPRAARVFWPVDSPLERNLCSERVGSPKAGLLALPPSLEAASAVHAHSGDGCGWCSGHPYGVPFICSSLAPLIQKGPSKGSLGIGLLASSSPAGAKFRCCRPVHRGSVEVVRWRIFWLWPGVGGIFWTSLRSSSGGSTSGRAHGVLQDSWPTVWSRGSLDFPKRGSRHSHHRTTGRSEAGPRDQGAAAPRDGEDETWYAGHQLKSP
jgi:hypothetical protein